MDDIIQAEGICKNFGGIRALQDVTLTIKKGEVHVIVGENGAGKSTFIKILAGVHQPDKGIINFNGENISIFKPYNSIKIGISPIFQESLVYENQSVLDNVFLVNRIKKKNSIFLDRKAMEVVCSNIFSELGEEIDPRENLLLMSAGRRKIVEIARALVQDAKCVIMDEPTSSLSEKEVEKLFDQIALLKRRGISIIYITHKLDEVYAIADRISVFRDGSLVGTYSADQLERQELIRLMIDRTLEQYFPEIEQNTGEKLLEVDNLSSDYGLFHNVSFSVKAGEVLGFYGLVGAGRSEIAQAVFGIDRNYTGTVKLNGRDFSRSRPDRVIGLGMAYLPEDRQSQGLVVDMDIKNNVTLATLKKLIRFVFFIDARRELKTTTELIEKLRIATTGPSQVVRALSGGNQQKVLVGKWLNVEPIVIILDEPTRGIDVGTKVEIYHLIKSLSRRGVGIVLISSELPEVMGLSHRVIVMNGGRLVSEYTGEAITKENIIKAALKEHQDN